MTLGVVIVSGVLTSVVRISFPFTFGGVCVCVAKLSQNYKDSEFCLSGA